MSLVPAQQALFPQAFISPLSHGDHGALRAFASTPASTALGANDRILYVPIQVGQPFTAIQFWVYNGATAAGNVQVGLYARDKTRLLTHTAAAQSGVDVLQAFDCTDTNFPPGLYYLAVTSTLSTATFRSWSSVPFSKMLGAYQEAGAGGLPTTATWLTASSGIVPLIGIATRATL